MDLSTIQVCDRRLIIPEFPTTNLLCVSQSIIDHHLNHIRVSALNHISSVSDLPDEVADTGYNISVVELG